MLDVTDAAAHDAPVASSEPDEAPRPEVIETEVAIIGAGVAGVSAATSLAQKGVDVTLIALRDRHPPDFRAEKTGEAQMILFDRLGLGDAARAAMTPFDGVWLRRFGRIVQRTTEREWGGDYSDLVNALRRALPKEVRQVIGRAETIETGPDTQTITLGDGRVVRARLLVVATGLSEALARKIGVRREVYSRAHSLAAGFTLKRPMADFDFPSLVWGGENHGDRLSYLTLFPIGETIRANLYVYRDAFEDWTKALRDAPEKTLLQMMPTFEQEFGKLELTAAPIIRPIDLIRTEGHERDGVVIVGDAFCTVCPITGTGIDKALTDVDRLCNNYVQDWLATPSMSVHKIRRYYADPVKRARDESAIRESLEARAIKVEDTLRWRWRRLRSRVFGRLRYVFG